MRNAKQLLLCAAAVLLFTGCGRKEQTELTESAAAAVTDQIDLDLTELSSTMVYSEVFNIMMEPEEYIGKTIKINGRCTLFRNQSTGNYYYSCIVQDATACCAKGIEFELADGYEYPEDGENVTVAGVFDTYLEGEYIYSTLRNARLF